MNLDAGSITWRAESDKIGFEHTTPLMSDAVSALAQLRRRSSTIGAAWVFPAPSDPLRPVSAEVARGWWMRAEAAAEIGRVRGRGWHCLRRKFATDLKGTPLPDLCHMGGWKDATTVIRCYQKPDEATMRAALERRKVVRAVGS